MRAVKVSYLMARSSDTVTYNVNTNPILTHGVTSGSRADFCRDSMSVCPTGAQDLVTMTIDYVTLCGPTYPLDVLKLQIDRARRWAHPGSIAHPLVVLPPPAAIRLT